MTATTSLGTGRSTTWGTILEWTQIGLVPTGFVLSLLGILSGLLWVRDPSITFLPRVTTYGWAFMIYFVSVVATGVMREKVARVPIWKTEECARLTMAACVLGAMAGIIVAVVSFHFIPVTAP